MNIELNAENFNTLLKDGELFLKANHSIHLFDFGEGLKMEMNWQGYGYIPKKIKIEFEYSKNTEFIESEE